MKAKGILKRITQIAAVAIIAFLVFTVVKGFIALSEKQAEIDALKKSYAELENRKAALVDLLSADERDIIERYARMKYNYTYPGETVYSDISKR